MSSAYSVSLEPIVWVARLFEGKDAATLDKQKAPFIASLTVIRRSDTEVEARGLAAPVSVSHMHAFTEALREMGVETLVMERHDGEIHRHRIAV